MEENFPSPSIGVYHPHTHPFLPPSLSFSFSFPFPFPPCPLQVPAKRQGLLGGMPAALWSRLSEMWPWSLGLLLPLGWLFALCLGGAIGSDEEEEELRRERVGVVRRVEGMMREEGKEGAEEKEAEQEEKTKKIGKGGREEEVVDDKHKDAGAKKNE